MTLDSILSIVKNIADIAIVWVIFYYILKNFKNNVKMSLLIKGVLVIVIIKLLSDWIGLPTVGWILEYVIEWGPLALIIIFQPEIRGALEQLGRSRR